MTEAYDITECVPRCTNDLNSIIANYSKESMIGCCTVKVHYGLTWDQFNKMWQMATDEKEFTDTYYDSAKLNLMKNNIWLHIRYTDWVLKKVTSHDMSHVMYKTIPERERMVAELRNVLEPKEEKPESPVDFPIDEMVSLRVIRRELFNKHNLKIYIERCFMGHDFGWYMLLTIQFQSPMSARLSCEGKEFQRSRSKILQYLVLQRKTDFELVDVEDPDLPRDFTFLKQFHVDDHDMKAAERGFRLLIHL